jgi:hypothetical protein
VTRRNNIVFTILAQFMGKEAVGDRLLLLETAWVATTPEKVLDVLARIVSDRALGKVFFKDYFLISKQRIHFEQALCADASQPLRARCY